MANRDLVAIGASAGGVEALVLLCTKLPAQFPAAILVTQHLPGHFNSALDRVLSDAGHLPATFADNPDRTWAATDGDTWMRRIEGIEEEADNVPQDHHSVRRCD